MGGRAGGSLWVAVPSFSLRGLGFPGLVGWFLGLLMAGCAVLGTAAANVKAPQVGPLQQVWGPEWHSQRVVTFGALQESASMFSWQIH